MLSAPSARRSLAVVLWACLLSTACDGGGDSGGTAGSGTAQPAQLGQSLPVSLSPGAAAYFAYGPVGRGEFFLQVTGLPRASTLSIRLHDGLYESVQCTFGEVEGGGPCNITLGDEQVGLELTLENQGPDAISFNAMMDRR